MQEGTPPDQAGPRGDYETNPHDADDVALAAINRVTLVERAPPTQVVPMAFGDSAVVLELRFWITRPRPPRMWQAMAEVVPTERRRQGRRHQDPVSAA
ncbi:MAG: hypothetical protein V5A24_08285 [Haloarculaceae archaeon]